MGILNAIRPKWKNSDADVRLAAAKELDDAATLTSIIIDDPEWFVRHNVFAHLRSLNPDQKWYAKLMQECEDEEVRRKVVKVMTELPDLERVAKEDKYQYVRDAAEHRIAEIREGTWTPGSDVAK